MPTVLESLNLALRSALDTDDRVILLGEDILDPYGGAFKVTRGLSTDYPDRVITTPISEAGIVGVATGMSLRGLRPVVEIMFGDFVTLIADQVINQAAKFRWMYSGGKSPEEQVSVPLVIRTPMGGRRGYGPTHSQTLEKLFLGVPGLRVLAVCNIADPGELLLNAIQHGDDPVLFIENKLLYLLPLQDPTSLDEFSLTTTYLNSPPSYPTYKLTLRDAPPPMLTLSSYGYMAELARQAVLRLAYEYEIFAELVIPTQLSPFEIEPVIASTRQTGKLLVVEEGSYSLGWGAEIIAQTAERLGEALGTSRRLAANDHPIPASGPLEDTALPGIEDIVQNAQKMV